MKGNTRFHLACAVTIATLCTQAGFAGESGGLTLSNALHRALSRNGILKGASLRVRAAEAEARQAGLPPNPELTVEVDEVAGSGTRTGLDSAEVTVVAVQPVELGGKAGRRRAVAALQTELEEWDHAERRINLVAGTSIAFTELLVAQAAVALAEDRLAVAQRLHSAVSRRVEAGKDARTEKSKVDVVVARAELTLEEAQVGLEVARSSLATIWGGDGTDVGPAAGALDVTAAPPAISTLRAAAAHPSIARLDAQCRRQEAERRLADVQRLPDVEIMGGVRWFEEDGDNAFLFGVGFPLPLFDRNQGTRAAALYRIAEAEAVRDQVKADQLAALDQAHGRMRLAHRRTNRFAARIVPAARSAYGAMEKGYAEGKFGLLPVLDAQRTLLDARRELLAARRDYQVAKIELERLTGRSLEFIPTDERSTR